MQDQTEHISKPEPGPNNAAPASVVTSETTTIKSTGPIPHEESAIGGTSVRGWIALVSIAALAVALVVAVFGKVPLDPSNQSLITMLAGLLAGIVSVYIGQGQKPKSK